jgi:hypothetical protein
MAWFGVGSGSRRAHEARRLRSNPAISLGAAQRFERKAWDRLIDCLITLPPLPSDD